MSGIVWNGLKGARLDPMEMRVRNEWDRAADRWRTDMLDVHQMHGGGEFNGGCCDYLRFFFKSSVGRSHSSYFYDSTAATGATQTLSG
jgi:hypothetical protein